MNKLFTLVRYSLTNSLGINRFIKKKKGSVFPVVLLVILAISSFLLFFFYMFMYGSVFNEVGASSGILILSVVFGSLMIALTSLSSVNGYLFSPKDFELLMSLPIKTNTIFLSKVIDLLIINYVTMLYFYLPGMIVYSFFNATNAIYWILATLTFFVLPLLPITVFGLIGYLFNLIKMDVRIKKMIRTIILLAVMVLILLSSFSLSNNASDEMFLELFNKLLKIYPVGTWAYNGIRGNIIQYLLFLLASIIPFIILIIFSGKNYLKSNISNRDIYISKSKEIKINASSKLQTLLKKELKNYFLFPMYVVNTIIGPILSVLATIFISIRVKADLVSFGETVVNMNDFLPFLMIIAISLTVSMSPITPASISLEGKSMWILKSAPIDYNDVKKAKLYTNYIVFIPFIILDTLILLFMRDFSWYEYLLIIIIPLILTISIIKIGLLINLLKPRFDYDNPVKAIKQGLPVLLTMFGSFVLMLIGVVPGLVTFVISLNKLISYIVILSLSVFIYILSSVLLSTLGKKCYYDIVC